jgi:5-methylcytosine-specific restriction endonuclease McrA
MNYHDYIASRTWRQNPARLAELEAAGFRCRICNDDGEASALEVHHRTYANLGHELPSDLTTLCRTCHRVVTDHLRRLRYANRATAHADIRQAFERPFRLVDSTFKENIKCP